MLVMTIARPCSGIPTGGGLAEAGFVVKFAMGTRCVLHPGIRVGPARPREMRRPA